MNRKKRGLGVFISYASTVVNMICGLVLSSFLLRALGDVEYGLYQTVASFASYLVLLEFGTGTVMTRNIAVCMNEPDPDKREEILRKNYSTVWIISFILSVVILLVSIIFYFNLNGIYAKTMTESQIAYAKNILLIMIVYILINYYTQNLSGYLLAREEYVFSKLVFLIKIIVRTVVLVTIIFFASYAVIIAIVDLVLSAAVLAVTLAFQLKKYKTKVRFRDFDKGVFRTSMPMCIAMLLQVLTNQANNNVDKFLLGIMMNLESVALYSIVQYIFVSFSSLATVPVTMFLPEVSKNMAKKLPSREFTDTLVNPCRLTVIICGSILCGFFAIGKQFIHVVYGASKTDAWLYTMIILVPMFIYMTTAVLLNVLDIANKRIVGSLVLFGTTIVNIALTVIFMNFWGIIGAVIATAIALVLGNIIVMNIYYQKKFHIHLLYLYKKAFAGLLPYQIIAAVIAFFVAKLIPGALVSMLAGGALYLVVSFGAIYLFGLKPAEKERMKKLFRRRG